MRFMVDEGQRSNCVRVFLQDMEHPSRTGGSFVTYFLPEQRLSNDYPRAGFFGTLTTTDCLEIRCAGRRHDRPQCIEPSQNL